MSEQERMMRNDTMNPLVICPTCQKQEPIHDVLTAQSNQNVIYTCNQCHHTVRNIETSKG
ncbi:hypothetical protein LCL95_02335 [Bacillus timonensis]|nr:hypothetical protein [Bacillus timonensis]